MMIGRGLGQTQSFPTNTALLAYCAANPTAEASYAPGGQSNGQTLTCAQWPSVLPQTATVVEGGCPSAEQIAGIVDPLDPCQSGTTTVTTSISTTTLVVAGIAALALFLMIGKH
jgi:hypothetical protein